MNRTVLGFGQFCDLIYRKNYSGYCQLHKLFSAVDTYSCLLWLGEQYLSGTTLRLAFGRNLFFLCSPRFNWPRDSVTRQHNITRRLYSSSLAHTMRRKFEHYPALSLKIGESEVFSRLPSGVSRAIFSLILLLIWAIIHHLLYGFHKLSSALDTYFLQSLIGMNIAWLSIGNWWQRAIQFWIFAHSAN